MIDNSIVCNSIACESFANHLYKWYNNLPTDPGLSAFCNYHAESFRSLHDIWRIPLIEISLDEWNVLNVHKL